MLQFIVLGLLPGTDTQIPFELFINGGAVTLLVFLIRFMWKHDFSTHQQSEEINQQSVAQ